MHLTSKCLGFCISEILSYNFEKPRTWQGIQLWYKLFNNLVSEVVTRFLVLTHTIRKYISYLSSDCKIYLLNAAKCLLLTLNCLTTTCKLNANSSCVRC